MTTWPATLPTKPLIGGYTENGPDLVLETEMDAGPPKQRRRFSAGVRSLDVSYKLTTAQVAFLETFYYTTIACVGEFDWTNPRTLATDSVKMTRPTYQALSDSLWQVTFKILIYP